MPSSRLPSAEKESTRAGSNGHAPAGDAMRRYWVRFAATGDPNQLGLPEWPVYQAARPRHLDIGDPVRAVEGLDRPGCDVFDEAWQARSDGPRGALR